ncbi:MAG: calcium-binding protein, partial [Beijerinckiaceae bacterium]
MPNTINGTPRNDTINGTTGDDEIFGQEGLDNIYAGNGNDIIHGGAGNRDGNQNLNGEAGNDTIYGGDSQDTINGGNDNDVLYGEGGNDSLNGNAGNDAIYAGDGDDYVYDYEGTNTIDLGSGDDYIEYVSYVTGVDTITGGAGSDVYSLFGGIATSPTWSADIITDFETGAGGDVIRLANVVGSFTGWTDALNPFTTGHLSLVTGDLDGDGDVDDTALRIDRDGSAGGAAAVTMLNLLNTAPGDFTIDNFSRDGNYLGWDPVGGIHLVDASVARVDNGTRSVYGSSDRDLINGSWESEYHYGREGADTINAAGGNDNLYGGSGDDVLNGGAGNDNLYGEAGADTLNADDGNDTLDGGAGNDTINGGDGDDTFYDSQGANTINGGAGDDNINYLGQTTDIDTVTGGTGRDVFNFALSRLINAAYAVDIITDFQTGIGGDELNVQSTGNFQNLPAGANPFVSGHLRLVQVGADTMLQGNRDGAGADWVDLLLLQNTTATAFGSTNFRFESGQLFGVTGVGMTLNGPRENIGAVFGDRDADTITLGNNGGQAFGRDGNDTLNGGDSNDNLYGEGGNDTLNGGSGNDYLDGGTGDDTLNGGDGNDNFSGTTAGNDTLNGGSGNDIFYDNQGNNTIDAGDGDDTVNYVGSGSGVDSITLGAGRDTILLDQTVIVNAANAVDTVEDFQTGVTGDIIDIANLAAYFQSWNGITNPFATGHRRVIAGDIDG